MPHVVRTVRVLYLGPTLLGLGCRNSPVYKECSYEHQYRHIINPLQIHIVKKLIKLD